MSRLERCVLSAALLLGPAVATAGGAVPEAARIPFDFILFGPMPVGVALFRRHTLPIAVGGMLAITLFKILVSPFRKAPAAAGSSRTSAANGSCSTRARWCRW